MTGGLFDPLGTDRPARPVRRPSIPAIVAVLLLAGMGALLLTAWWRDDGGRGFPVAVAPIVHVDAPQPPPPAPAAAPSAAPAPSASPTPPVAAPAAEAFSLPPVQADQEVEIQNGVRIVRPRRIAPAATGQQIIQVRPAP